jgi:hypothetical protein
VIWQFTHRKEEIRLETWYDKYTSEFVVDIAHSDGQTESKRFLNDRVFQTWLAMWGGQLLVNGWTQSGPFLSVPERPPIQPVDAAVAAGGATNPPQSAASPAAGGGDTKAADSATIIKRTYSTGTHSFEVTLSRISLREQPLWMVVSVTETSRAGKRLLIAGMHAVVSSAPDATFARACDRIDKWLLATSRV